MTIEKLNIKVCTTCMRINLIEAEKCLQCGSDTFDDVYQTPFYDSIESYHTREDDNE